MRKFIWYDLMVSDLASATKFYSDVIGWKIADAGMPGMSYSIIGAGDIMVGGLMQAEAGMSPPWQGHIYSPDVDADVKRVTAAGGHVHREPEDIPGIGRFAVVSDPGGAAFILFKPNSTEQPEQVPPGTLGHIGWRELHAADGGKAWDFYSALFGWRKSADMEMPGNGVYRMFDVGDGDMAGGMMTKQKSMPEPLWVYYFNVPAIDAAAARVRKGGGKILLEPMEVPGGQWALNARDPQGHIFGLLAPAK